MRVDFREERRWKLVVAYTLAHAVMEWHEAGSLEERVRRGICVLWRPDDRREEDESMNVDDDRYNSKEMFDAAPESKGESTPANDDNSEDDSDVEQEKDRQAVLSALEPSTVLQEALEDIESGRESQNAQYVQPKVEDTEDSSLSHLAAVTTQANPDGIVAGKSVHAQGSHDAVGALKIGANDPILADQAVAQPEPPAAPSTSKPRSKPGMYAHLREQIVFSDVEKVFVDLDDLELAKNMSELSTEDASVFAPPAANPSSPSPFALMSLSALPPQPSRRAV